MRMLQSEVVLRGSLLVRIVSARWPLVRAPLPREVSATATTPMILHRLSSLFFLYFVVLYIELCSCLFEHLPYLGHFLMYVDEDFCLLFVSMFDVALQKFLNFTFLLLFVCMLHSVCSLRELYMHYVLSHTQFS